MSTLGGLFAYKFWLAYRQCVQGYRGYEPYHLYLITAELRHVDA